MIVPFATADCSGKWDGVRDLLTSCLTLRARRPVKLPLAHRFEIIRGAMRIHKLHGSGPFMADLSDRPALCKVSLECVCDLGCSDSHCWLTHHPPLMTSVFGWWTKKERVPPAKVVRWYSAKRHCTRSAVFQEPPHYISPHSEYSEEVL